MKKNFFLILLVILTGTLQAQTFEEKSTFFSTPLDPMYWSSNISNITIYGSYTIDGKPRLCLSTTEDGIYKNIYTDELVLETKFKKTDYNIASFDIYDLDNGRHAETQENGYMITQNLWNTDEHYEMIVQDGTTFYIINEEGTTKKLDLDCTRIKVLLKLQNKYYLCVYFNDENHWYKVIPDNGVSEIKEVGRQNVLNQVLKYTIDGKKADESTKGLVIIQDENGVAKTVLNN